jgi:hypothetical protein
LTIKLSNYFTIPFFVAICLIKHTALASPSQQWIFTTARLWQEQNQRLDLTFHTRLSGLDQKPTLYQLQPRYSMKCGEYFRCAANYSFFSLNRTSNSGEEQIEHQNRFEGELNPHFTFNEELTYQGRNRFEYLLDERYSEINSRFRHRDLLEVKHPLGLKIKAFVSNEIFYSFGDDSLNQFRFVPLGFRFPWLGNEYSLYPMLLSNKSNGEWDHALVIGLDLFFDFSD